MRHFAKLQFVAGAVLLLIAAFAKPASADQISETISGCSACNGYTFQATLNSLGNNNYSLSYVITDASGPAATAQGWSLTLFQSGNDVTYTAGSLSVLSSNSLINNSAAYTVMAGKSNNGNGDCNSTLSDAICVTTSGSGSPSVIGQSLAFSFNFSCPNCTELSSWDFLSHGTCVGGTGNCYAVTNWGGGTVGVPEPSVLALLASEMALMVGVVLVFGPIRNRVLHRWVSLFRLQPRLTS